MATEIRAAPILKGKQAKAFIKMTDDNLLNKHTIDFTEQVLITKKILKKAKLL